MSRHKARYSGYISGKKPPQKSLPSWGHAARTLLQVKGLWAFCHSPVIKQVLVACLEESLLYFLGSVHKGGEHGRGWRWLELKIMGYGCWFSLSICVKILWHEEFVGKTAFLQCFPAHLEMVHYTQAANFPLDLDHFQGNKISDRSRI